MAMLTLNGIIENVYSTPATVNRETGETRPAADYAQILAHNVLESGEKKLEMVTLKVHNLAAFKRLEGQRVSVPVGYFADASKTVRFYSLRNEPDPVPAAA